VNAYRYHQDENMNGWRGRRTDMAERWRIVLFGSYFLRALSATMLLATGGCFDSGGNSSVDARPPSEHVVAEPCALITPAEVETALGAGATKTQVRNPRLGYNECHLQPGRAKDVTERIIIVRQIDNRLWQGMKEAFPDNKPEPGVGDDAFSRLGTGFNVLKGQSWIQICCDYGDVSPAQEKANRYLAERAASRL
jgi:hypothetical protein